MSACIKDYDLMTDRKLDWKSRHDPQSKNYPIRTIFGPKGIVPVKTMWDEGIVLDQGSEGACVGFAWTGELLAQPAAPKEQPSFHYANNLAIAFYNDAKRVDQWPGENYEGTSVLAGAKIMKERGLIGEYRWCFSINDVRDAVITEGPVVIGIPWYNGMYDTDQNGIVRISGDLVGGHAILLTGYDPAMRIGNSVDEYFRWRNSWGEDYGVDGSGWIRRKDLEKLLLQNGEACVPMQRQIPVFKEPRKGFFAKLFNK